MPPRVAFWTSAFESEMEAVASEVTLLRRRLPGSIAWGLSPRNWLHLSTRRGCIFHPRLHWLFRMVTWCLEPTFQVNHVFGSIGDWFYLQSQKRRPTIVTMATQGPPVAESLLQRVNVFVGEYPGARELLQRYGIAPERIRIILPPVDLERFSVAPRPAEPFTVLFASSPDKASWLEARGVHLILDAAGLRPSMQFRLLWRPWGDALERVTRWIAERGLTNVTVDVDCCGDMPRQYAEAHVTVAPFLDPHRSKPAPNSVIESLSCGRPVLVTPQVGLSDLIQDAHAGVVSATTGEALAENLSRLQAEWPAFSRSARHLAEKCFGADRFVRSYQQLYQDVLAPARRTS